MTPTPIESLVESLLAELRGDVRGRRVARMLGEYCAGHEDWRPYAQFDDEVYTRNLVVREVEFEMLVLCWNVGQQSPIHNHAGQQCWMAILEGEIEEQLYTLPSDGRPGPLVPGRTMRFPHGRVAYIDDEIALHRVRPVAGTRGTSLHLYSRPIDVCHVYDEGTGNVVPRKLAYHSVGAGKPARPRLG